MHCLGPQKFECIICATLDMLHKALPQPLMPNGPIIPLEIAYSGFPPKAQTIRHPNNFDRMILSSGSIRRPIKAPI